MKIVSLEYRRAPDMFKKPRMIVQYRPLEYLSRSIEINKNGEALSW
jgi:hypothetical protein